MRFPARVLTAPLFVLFCLSIAFLVRVMPGVRANAIVNNSVPVSSVSAASFVGAPAPIAPGSIVAAFGTQLASGTLGATTQPLPTLLLGTSVTVNGTAAPIFFVSPGQVNFLVPSTVSAGDAQVVITATATNGDQIVSRGTLKIANVVPAIFTANANGAGVPAAVTGRVNAGGQFVFDAKAPFEPNPLQPGQFLPSPIDVGTEQQPAFLILFATGLSKATAGSTRAVIGGVEVAVTPVAAPGFTGLEQINLQLPVSLKGQGTVELTLVSNGIASNVVQVNLAGAAAAGLAINSFSTTTPAIVGQTVTINGSGFSTTAAQNTVRIGAAQARVISATGTQLAMIVPFGAESSRVTVANGQGEVRSDATFRINTSVSGIVQSTGTATASPSPLGNVTVRVVGTNVSVKTNPQGTFVIPNMNPGVEFLEIDGGTTGANPPFPKVTLKATVRADRDNLFPQAISLQQVTGGSGTVGTVAPGDAAELRQQLSESILRQPQAPSQLPGAGKVVTISNGGVTLEVPLGTTTRFTDGKTSGQVQLTVVQRSRLPGFSLPLGVYSSAIAQITPLGTTFSPGASISFPNPDTTTLGPGTKVDLYRYDFDRGTMVKRGTGTVSSDRQKIVSDGRIVDVASFWLAAAASNVTSVRGRVIDAAGLPVPGAKVSVNGRWNTTDANGGFNIQDVATLGVQQVQAEAVLPLQYGTIPRATSAATNVVPNGVTNVGNIRLNNTNQAAIVLSPFNLDFDSNSPPARMDATLTQPAPAGGIVISLASSSTGVATVPASVTIPAGQTTAQFNVTRTGAGFSVIEARATLSGTALSTAAIVTVSKAGPQLAAVNPASAPPGGTITITGTGISGIADNNIVGFGRNNQLLAVLDPDDNVIVRDPSGRPALRVTVPPLPAGPVLIGVATIDEETGIISDASNTLNFTVIASDVAAPVLTSVTPGQGRPRDQVVINGTGFSANADENRVFFRQGLSDTRARVVRATTTQLTVLVPSQGLTAGNASIFAGRVAANGARSNASNALDFTLTGDVAAPATPTLAAVQPNSGRDGTTVQLTGTNLGRNFYVPETDSVGNAEPFISLFLYYQNNLPVNFSLATAAQSGTQVSTIIPTGLNPGPIQITTATFDLESGLISDESNPANFTISTGSLRRVDEDEPNDSPDTSTDVALQTIVDGRTALDDAFEYEITFDDGTKERLHDWFYLPLSSPTALTLTLSFNLPADLDLFVIEEDENGDLNVVEASTREQTPTEALTGTLPAGNYYIVVGTFSGSSPYTLALQQGSPSLTNFMTPAWPTANARRAVRVKRIER